MTPSYPRSSIPQRFEPCISTDSHPVVSVSCKFPDHHSFSLNPLTSFCLLLLTDVCLLLCVSYTFCNLYKPSCLSSLMTGLTKNTSMIQSPRNQRDMTQFQRRYLTLMLRSLLIGMRKRKANGQHQ
jgi:hypothetical protein